VINGVAAGRVLTLGMGRTLTIGRAPTNDLELVDPAISGEHCRVKPEDGGYVLYDVESTNGTMVNGVPVDRHVLKPGDVISLGQVGISFSVD
jgi:pSer/pThr/pTyr-binding forkhead associated (FHA) protein